MKNLRKYRIEKGITKIRLSIESGVSVDFLLDRTDNPLVNINKDIGSEMMNLYNQLNKEQKEDVLKYARIRKEM